jgi:hypothetical protein
VSGGGVHGDNEPGGWDAEDPSTPEPAAQSERLERELLIERRKVVERDIQIAELRAQLEATCEPPADGGT